MRQNDEYTDSPDAAVPHSADRCAGTNLLLRPVDRRRIGRRASWKPRWASGSCAEQDGDTCSATIGAARRCRAEADMMNVAVSAGVRGGGALRPRTRSANCSAKRSQRRRRGEPCLTLEVRELPMPRLSRSLYEDLGFTAGRPAEKLLSTPERGCAHPQKGSFMNTSLRGILLRRDRRRHRGGRQTYPDGLHRLAGRAAPALRRRRA